MVFYQVICWTLFFADKTKKLKMLINDKDWSNSTEISHNVSRFLWTLYYRNDTSTLTTTVIYLNGINVQNVFHMWFCLLRKASKFNSFVFWNSFSINFLLLLGTNMFNMLVWEVHFGALKIFLCKIKSHLKNIRIALSNYGNLK